MSEINQTPSRITERIQPCPKCKRPYNADWSSLPLCAKCYVRSTAERERPTTFEEIKQAYEQCMKEE